MTMSEPGMTMSEPGMTMGMPDQVGHDGGGARERRCGLEKGPGRRGMLGEGAGTCGIAGESLTLYEIRSKDRRK